MDMDAEVVDWLLDADPAIRWQVLQDLLDAPADDVAAERSRVAHEGLGAAVLAARGDDGLWAGGAWAPRGWSWHEGTPQPWTSTSWVLEELCDLGMPAEAPVMAETVALIAANGRWEYHDGPFWDGEVDSCINGRTIRAGARFGADVSAIVAYCEEDQQTDGGWNCFRLEDGGSSRSSFASTLSVLEGLLEHERRTGVSSADMRVRGVEFLLERSLMRGLRSGEIVDERYLRFPFPPRWRYDVLHALDHLRLAGVAPEPRMDEAIAAVRAARQPDGRWLAEDDDPGAVTLRLDAPAGEPSRWTTMRALRVLRWFDETR